MITSFLIRNLAPIQRKQSRYFVKSRTEQYAGNMHNHSACAGWQGLGGGAYQQAFAEVINSALLATTIFSSGQRYIFNGLQVCDPCYRGIILLLLIHLNQGQCFSCATFSSVPASRIYRKYKASRFSTRSILPL